MRMRRDSWSEWLGLGLIAAAVALTPLTAWAAAEWQVYLEDSFQCPETMFYTGQAGEAFYSIDEQGRYVIDGLTTSSDSLSALTDSLYYYYVEAQCELLKSTAGELAFSGVVFHYNKSIPGKLSYYVFYVYGDGYYGAKRVIGDDIDIIIPLTPTDLLDLYGVNVLAVDAQGTRFDLYVNGRYVDGFTDVRVDGGGFGFYISKNSRSAFDDFKVKVERRDGGREEPELPAWADKSNLADSTGGGSFSGYRFPEIPKDPNRPTYPWEVGVDKTGKGAPPPQEPPPSDTEPETDAEATAPAEPPREPAEPVTEVEQEETEPAQEAVEPEQEIVEPAPEPVQPAAGIEQEETEPEPEPEPVVPPSAAAEPETGAEVDAQAGEEAQADAEREPGRGDLMLRPPVADAAVGDGASAAAAPQAVERLEPVTPDEFRLPPGEELVAGELAEPPEEPALASTEPVTDDQAWIIEPLQVTSFEPAALEPSAEVAAAGDALAVLPVADIEEEELPAAAGEPRRLIQPPVIPRPDILGLAKLPGADEAVRPLALAEAAETTDDELGLFPPAEATALDELVVVDESVAGDDRPVPPSEFEPPDEALPAPLELIVEGTEPEAASPAEPAPVAETVAEAEEIAPPTPREIADAMRDQSEWGEDGEVVVDYGFRQALAASSQSAASSVDTVEEQPAQAAAGEQVVPGAGSDTSAAAGEAELPLFPQAEAIPAEGPQGREVSFGALEPKLEGLGVGEFTEITTTEEEGTSLAELPLLPEPAPASAPVVEAIAEDYFAREGVTVVEDDFAEERWPLSEGEACSYRYFGAAYEIDNLQAETMAISYQDASFADCELSVDLEYLDGASYVGYGLAGRFNVVDGQVSYYGLFISQSGEFLLLKVHRGAERVLADWTAASQVNVGRPNRITLAIRGEALTAFVNGEAVVSVRDSDITAGGYALLAGPGTAVRFDNMLVRGYAQ